MDVDGLLEGIYYYNTERMNLNKTFRTLISNKKNGHHTPELQAVKSQSKRTAVRNNRIKGTGIF